MNPRNYERHTNVVRVSCFGSGMGNMIPSEWSRFLLRYVGLKARDEDGVGKHFVFHDLKLIPEVHWGPSS